MYILREAFLCPYFIEHPSHLWSGLILYNDELVEELWMFEWSPVDRLAGLGPE